MAKGKVSKNGPTMKVNWNRIEALLKQENISGQALSEMLGYSKWYLSSSKNSKTKGLPFNVIKEISDMFSVKFEDLLADSKTEPEKSEDDEELKKIVETMEDLHEQKKSLEEKAMPKTAYLTDGEDTMTLQFSDNEFRRIVELTKHFGLNRTTDLFHKLLNDAWFKYRKEKLKDELGRLPEAELLKRYIASVFGTDNYSKDDLVRKIADDAMRRYSDV